MSLSVCGAGFPFRVFLVCCLLLLLLCLMCVVCVCLCCCCLSVFVLAWFVCLSFVFHVRVYDVSVVC